MFYFLSVKLQYTYRSVYSEHFASEPLKSTHLTRTEQKLPAKQTLLCMQKKDWLEWTEAKPVFEDEAGQSYRKDSSPDVQ